MADGIIAYQASRDTYRWDTRRLSWDVEDEPEVIHVAFQSEISGDELLNHVVSGVLKGAVLGLGGPKLQG